MKNELRHVGVKFPLDTFEQIKKIALKEDINLSETVRRLVYIGLSIEYVNESKDIIADIVREQMDIVIKPHIERLASLSAKSGIASATSMFLNTQALMDLVPVERKKDVRTMFDKAKVKGVQYIKTRTEDLETEE